MNQVSQKTVELILANLKLHDGKPRTTYNALIADGVDVSYGTVQNLSRGGHYTQTMTALDPLTRSDLVRLLHKGWATIDALAQKLRILPQAVSEAIGHLEARGYNIVRDGERARIVKEPATSSSNPRLTIDGSPLSGDWKQFGVVADTHLCSHYERLDVLHDAYRHFADEGITTVFHAGNMVDGHTTFNRFKLYCHGITDQVEYLLDNYPKKKGITTHFITGACHEGWWTAREGIDFGRYLQAEAHRAGRDDLVYLGTAEADVELTSPGGGRDILRIIHPGGGSSYAISYATQKIVESLGGGEKPGVLIVGHFHKALYHMVRNVHVLQAGCCQDQSLWMRNRSIASHVGYWTVQYQQDAKGAVRRFRPAFTNYYDRGYHVVSSL